MEEVAWPYYTGVNRGTVHWRTMSLVVSACDMYQSVTDMNKIHNATE